MECQRRELAIKFHISAGRVCGIEALTRGGRPSTGQGHLLSWITAIDSLPGYSRIFSSQYVVPFLVSSSNVTEGAIFIDASDPVLDKL